jgi:hypothetical protein
MMVPAQNRSSQTPGNRRARETNTKANVETMPRSGIAIERATRQRGSIRRQGGVPARALAAPTLGRPHGLGVHELERLTGRRSGGGASLGGGNGGPSGDRNCTLGDIETNGMPDLVLQPMWARNYRSEAASPPAVKSGEAGSSAAAAEGSSTGSDLMPAKGLTRAERPTLPRTMRKAP